MNSIRPLSVCQQKLVVDHLSLCNLSRRYPRLEDAWSVAEDALIAAASTFDPTRGASFATYAFHKIREYLHNAYTRRRQTDTVELLPHLSPTYDLRHLDDRDEVDALMRRLTPGQRDVLEGYRRGETTSEIARRRGTSRQAVRAIVDAVRKGVVECR